MAINKPKSISAATPARGIARVDAIAKTLKPAPAPMEPAPAAVEAEPIEDVVGVSPVIETLTAAVAEMPKGIVAPVDLAKTQTKAKTTMENAMKSAEQMVSFGQGNMEAMMKSSQIWAAGIQDMGKHFAASAQAQLDETMASVKALTSVKSLKEAVEMQTAMSKSAMEKMMAETGKITDASVKLAEQAMAPIAARMTLATETFGRSV